MKICQAITKLCQAIIKLKKMVWIVLFINESIEEKCKIMKIISNFTISSIKLRLQLSSH